MDRSLIDELIYVDGLECLETLLDDQKESLRGLVSFTVRNIYYGKPVYMSKIQKHSVMKKMLDILPTFEDPQNLLDHLLNLEDYIYDSN